MYQITTDLKKAVIEVKFEGFWSIDHVESFAQDLREQVARIALTGRRQAVLYDYSDAAIQSQAVVGALQDMARRDDFNSRRIAFYSSGKIANLQAKRVAAVASDRIAMFRDRDEAMEWLAA